MKIRILFVLLLLFGLGCAHGQYKGPNPEQCRDLVDIAQKLTVVAADVATDDESKRLAIGMSTEIAAEIARLGCSYVPETPQPEADQSSSTQSHGPLWSGSIMQTSSPNVLPQGPTASSAGSSGNTSPVSQSQLWPRSA